jgi:hypothetical protein
MFGNLVLLLLYMYSCEFAICHLCSIFQLACFGLAYFLHQLYNYIDVSYLNNEFIKALSIGMQAEIEVRTDRKPDWESDWTPCPLPEQSILFEHGLGTSQFEHVTVQGATDPSGSIICYQAGGGARPGYGWFLSTAGSNFIQITSGVYGGPLCYSVTKVPSISTSPVESWVDDDVTEAELPETNVQHTSINTKTSSTVQKTSFSGISSQSNSTLNMQQLPSSLELSSISQIFKGSDIEKPANGDKSISKSNSRQLQISDPLDNFSSEVHTNGRKLSKRSNRQNNSPFLQGEQLSDSEFEDDQLNLQNTEADRLFTKDVATTSNKQTSQMSRTDSLPSNVKLEVQPASFIKVKIWT